MLLPTIEGLIERRVLVNFRVDPDTLQRLVPAPFRVLTVDGYGMAGVCLIRLAQVRPRFVPRWLGLRSENAAHRIAVAWPTPQGLREGVFIPRRDTSSWFNVLVGGRLFPGRHHRARFDVAEHGDDVRITLRSADGATRVHVEGNVAPQLPPGSVFASLEAASAFFERGSIGHSATPRDGCFDCLELRSFGWRVQALAVRSVQSSFFDDPARFPPGTVTFDSALLMRGIRHQWHAHAPLRDAPP